MQHPRRLAAALTVAAAALTGCSSGAAVTATDTARPTSSLEPTSSPVRAASPHPGLAAYRVARPDAYVPLPVRLRIPELAIDTPLDELGQAPDRTVEVPDDPLRAGWYARGPRPGQAGPAVLLGHVDGQSRPGVFFRVRELQVGAILIVERADGTEARFQVTRLERMPKTAFPTSEVYLPTAGPELRLVTCGGGFDAATGHYRDNVIAYAELTA